MTDANLELDGEFVTLRFDRVVETSVDHTWAALVEPSVLKEWLAEAQFDAVVGGEVHLVWPGLGEMRGTVHVCEAPTVLEYTWEESDGPSLVRFEISARDDTSSLRFTHSGTSRAGASGFGAGWQSHFEALDVVLAGGTSTPEERNARYDELHPSYVEAVAQLSD
jgi:uncharacterized protein YndB with AHSA1/START domain